MCENTNKLMAKELLEIVNQLITSNNNTCSVCSGTFGRHYGYCSIVTTIYKYEEFVKGYYDDPVYIQMKILENKIDALNLDNGLQKLALESAHKENKGQAKYIEKLETENLEQRNLIEKLKLENTELKNSVEYWIRSCTYWRDTYIENLKKRLTTWMESLHITNKERLEFDSILGVKKPK